MRGWGLTLLVLAILSAILPRFGIQFILLMWVDNWGPTIGWCIRGALAVLGVVLMVADRRAKG